MTEWKRKQNKNHSRVLFIMLRIISVIFLSLEIMLIFEAGRHIKCKNDNLVEAIPHIYLSFQQYSCPI